MLFRPAAFALLAVAAFAALPSSAQNIKPGLWEINNKMQSSNGELDQAMAMMHKHMAAMSQQERKQMEDMMARNGITMPSAGPDGAMMMKFCMTKEMAERKQLPLQQHGNCTHRQSPMVGNTMKVSFTCTQPQASGEGKVTFHSDTAYSATMRVTSAQEGSANAEPAGKPNGRPHTMSMDATARWLGADCGSVRPPAPPPAR